MSPQKRRSVIDVTRVRGFLEGGPLAQADVKKLPLGTMPQVRQAGIHEGGVGLPTVIRKAAKTHQTRCPAVPPHTLGSAMNALSVTLEPPFTLTDLGRYVAVRIGSSKDCDNLLALCPSHSIEIGKIMPK